MTDQEQFIDLFERQGIQYDLWDMRDGWPYTRRETLASTEHFPDEGRLWILVFDAFFVFDGEGRFLGMWSDVHHTFKARLGDDEPRRVAVSMGRL